MIMNKIRCLVNELMPIDYGRFEKVHRAKMDPKEYLTWNTAYDYFVNNCSRNESKKFQKMAISNYSLP